MRLFAGRSEFAMVAVNPMRVHSKLFREKQLNQVVASITQARPQKLLQVSAAMIVFFVISQRRAGGQLQC